jgi:hypothetical protein
MEHGHAHRVGYGGASPVPPSDTTVRAGPYIITVLEYGKAHASGELGTADQAAFRQPSYFDR